MNVKIGVIIIILIIMFLESGFAQIVPPPMRPPPPPGLPINNYTFVLFLAGIIFGVKKIYKNS